MSGISIIIVNYNVKYFIRQCLQSIYENDFSGDIQVIVVDNNSLDGSNEMIQNEFPQVQLLLNKDNLGFSKANNQGLNKTEHPYTLILNPDTILQEDTLGVCYDFMKHNEDCGAMGVKMVDGSGKYLPESKRGFPTPLSSLFKMTGLGKIFNRSRLFNYYYLGHLDEGQTNQIDVLTGAFMFARTSLLKNLGGFDEDYFMYGEDIELSYQIKKSGFKIFYLPQTQIIHFKGESTKKLSTSYLKNFYGAMRIYARKRNSAVSFLWSWVLNLGITVTALTSVFKKLSLSILKPLIDGAILLAMAFISQKVWASLYFKDPNYYSKSNFLSTYLVLIPIIIACYYLFGQYDNRHNIKHLLYSFLISTLGVLSIYGLLPVELRSSRIILLFIVAVTPIILYLTRRVYNAFDTGASTFNAIDSKRVAVIGTAESYKKISEIVTRFSGQNSLVGRIDIKEPYHSLGSISDLKDIVHSRGINEVVFCSSDLKTKEIFKMMADLGNKVVFKLANNDNTTILGSSSKERVGEWYAMDISFKIDEPFHIRTKRLIDLLFVVIALVLFPIVVLFSRHRKKIYSNLLSIIFSKKTWLGYNVADKQLSTLPQLKEGVFQLQTIDAQDTEAIHRENLWYARNYSTWTELAALIKNLFR